jgi:uncharacterized membrane protein YkoI
MYTKLGVMKYAAALALMLLAASPALADNDQDRARALVLSGKVLPLGKILDKVAADFPGEVIEAELEGDHSRPVYEIKLITPKGTVMKLIYDATDATLLKSRERGH